MSENERDAARRRNREYARRKKAQIRADPALWAEYARRLAIANKRAEEKRKQDPERLERHRAYKREYARKWRQAVYDDPARYAEYCERTRQWSKDSYHRMTPEQRQRDTENTRRWVAANKERVRQLAAASRAELKRQVFEAYGRVCACCGEGREPFLAIDHIDGGGNKHRKEVLNGNSRRFYAWLRQQGFPPGFRVLCHNCNQARGIFGYCPHERSA